jgi:hypothetical protein
MPTVFSLLSRTVQPVRSMLHLAASSSAHHGHDPYIEAVRPSSRRHWRATITSYLFSMCVSLCVVVCVCVLQRQQQEADSEDEKDGEDFAEGFEVVHCAEINLEVP